MVDHVVVQRGRVLAPVLAGAVGLALGVLTAYAQGWLPVEVGSLANSSGSWTLVAFLLALLATSAPLAALCGALALLGLLAGYIMGAGIMGNPSSSSLLVFWGVAAVVVGPLLGLAAHWVRFGSATVAAVGAGGLAGVLIGEGVYGLGYVADTTYPPYWWLEILAGLTVLCAVGMRRLRSVRPVALSVLVAAVVAAAFIVVYSEELILLL